MAHQEHPDDGMTLAGQNLPSPRTLTEDSGMSLTHAQHDAMLALGGTPSDDDFVTKNVLDELLSLELVYWREGELEFTKDGERVYKELAAG
jgi:hypothetical protein